MGKASRRMRRAVPEQPGSGSRSRSRTVPRRWLIVGVPLALLVALAAVVVGGHHTNATSRSPVSMPVTGASAPPGDYTLVDGRSIKVVSSLRGRPALIWFVSTWCSSCEAGTQVMAQNIAAFSRHHVRVVELELARDLGQPGPSIASFGQSLAARAYRNPDWSWGVASSPMTTAYDPRAYLDVYYLLNARGQIVYINGSPSSTMGGLLNAIGTLGA